MMTLPWLLFIATLQTVDVQRVVGYFQPNVTKPMRNEGLCITCSLSGAAFVIFYNYNLSPRQISGCNLELQMCIPSNYHDVERNLIYRLAANSSTAWVEILSVDRTRDQGLWRCEESISKYENLTFTVHSSPVGLSFVSPPPTAVDLAETSVTLECKTNSCCYPEPTLIAWYYQTNSGPAVLNVGTTRRINSTGNCTQQEKIFSIIIELSHGTNFTGNIPMITLRCGIVHPVFDIIQFSGNSINVTFAVYVSSVTLIPGNSSITFLEGDQMIIKCVTSPSRPHPQIRWWVGNEIKVDNIKESISNSGNLIIMESEITLMLNQSYRNRLLYCDSQVPEQGTWISSFKSQINVWYPPSVPTVLTYSQGFPWLENRTGILECNISEPGNPAASITWASTRGKPDGLSHLILENLTANDNGLAVKCNLSNTFTVLKHLVVESLVRNLEVEYTPEITFVPSQTSVTIIETRDLLVTCNSRGNPIPSVEWLNKSQLSDILYMQNVSRHDSGTYICMAKSISTSYGRISLQSQKQLKLTVQFAPEMSVKVTPSIVEVNSEVHIECSAHGEPSNYTFYDWIHKLGNNKVRHIKGILANQSTLGISFPSITIADMGTYICLVDNGITGPDGGIVQSMEAQINVIGVPVAFVSDATFIGETNMSTSIRIPFFSNPSITDLKFFKTWNIALIANDTDTQVYHTEANISTVFHNTDVILQGMTAVLHFRSLKESDFGQYTLVLYNNKGTATLIVHLKASEPNSDANNGPSIAGIAGGIGGGVVVIVVTGIVICLWRRHSHTNKAADGTACISTAENYETLQAKNNEGSLYQELSDIKSCANAENSFRRNETKTTENQPTYINTKETVSFPQDQGNF